VFNLQQNGWPKAFGPPDLCRWRNCDFAEGRDGFALNHPDAADRFVGSIMLSADAVVLMLLAQRTSFERVVRPVWMFDSFAALPHSRPKARVAVVIVYHR
jgi:hypothetical protein